MEFTGDSSAIDPVTAPYTGKFFTALTDNSILLTGGYDIGYINPEFEVQAVDYSTGLNMLNISGYKTLHLETEDTVVNKGDLLMTLVDDVNNPTVKVEVRAPEPGQYEYGTLETLTEGSDTPSKLYPRVVSDLGSISGNPVIDFDLISLPDDRKIEDFYIDFSRTDISSADNSVTKGDILFELIDKIANPTANLTYTIAAPESGTFRYGDLAIGASFPVGDRVISSPTKDAIPYLGQINKRQVTPTDTYTYIQMDRVDDWKVKNRSTALNVVEGTVLVTLEKGISGNADYETIEVKALKAGYYDPGTLAGGSVAAPSGINYNLGTLTPTGGSTQDVKAFSLREGDYSPLPFLSSLKISSPIATGTEVVKGQLLMELVDDVNSPSFSIPILAPHTGFFTHPAAGITTGDSAPSGKDYSLGTVVSEDSIISNNRSFTNTSLFRNQDHRDDTLSVVGLVQDSSGRIIPKLAEDSGIFIREGNYDLALNAAVDQDQFIAAKTSGTIVKLENEVTYEVSEGIFEIVKGFTDVITPDIYLEEYTITFSTKDTNSGTVTIGDGVYLDEDDIIAVAVHRDSTATDTSLDFNILAPSTGTLKLFEHPTDLAMFTSGSTIESSQRLGYIKESYEVEKGELLFTLKNTATDEVKVITSPFAGTFDFDTVRDFQDDLDFDANSGSSIKLGQINDPQVRGSDTVLVIREADRSAGIEFDFNDLEYPTVTYTQSNLFTTADIGKEIVAQEGRIEIVSILSSTEVSVKIIEMPTNFNASASGAWSIESPLKARESGVFNLNSDIESNFLTKSSVSGFPLTHGSNGDLDVGSSSIIGSISMVIDYEEKLGVYSGIEQVAKAGGTFEVNAREFETYNPDDLSLEVETPLGIPGFKASPEVSFEFIDFGESDISKTYLFEHNDGYVEDGRFVREGELIFSYIQSGPETQDITIDMTSSNTAGAGLNLSQMIISSDLEGGTYQVRTAAADGDTIAAGGTILELVRTSAGSTTPIFIISESPGTFRPSAGEVYKAGDTIKVEAEKVALSNDNNLLYGDLTTIRSDMSVPSDITGYYISSIAKFNGDDVIAGDTILTLTDSSDNTITHPIKSTFTGKYYAPSQIDFDTPVAPAAATGSTPAVAGSPTVSADELIGF
ncbi:hypothetical protein AB751O23_CL_00010, partial [Chlamydiales bacterium SCGC AB-751-O23]